MPFKNHSTWITANQRLALYFHQQYDRTQQTTGQTVWETLDCLSLKRWILRAYQTLPQAIQFVLSEHQELVLWEQVITHSLVSMQPELAFLSTYNLAKTAQAAWRLLKESHTPLHLLASADSQEVTAFYQWARLFERRCHEKNCIDFSVCTDQVIDSILTRKLVLPTQITLAGFEEISSQTKQLFAVLAEQCEVKYNTTKATKNNHIQKTGLGNENLELQAMAQWAYQMQLENPDQLIGCVIPDLNAKRHTVEHIFNAVFSCNATFNISGGFPFHHFPLIQTAFDVLKLGVSALDINLLGRLLNTPFLGGAEQELTARANLDVQLRETREPQIYWQKMQSLARKQGDCAIWLAQCEQYLAHYHQTDYQSAHAWSRYFAEQLQCMGWPGERAVNSSEYQQIQRWYLLLEEFSSLDTVLEKSLSRTKAIHHLFRLAQATVFQPKTAHASVQVLGLLEAIGLPFAGVWICGMTQQNWPSSAAPNPFIPFALQRDRNMPHASAERELAYSRVLTNHFCQHAATVIFSYPLQKEDQPQAPSALIRDLPEISESIYPLDLKELDFSGADFPENWHLNKEEEHLSPPPCGRGGKIKNQLNNTLSLPSPKGRGVKNNHFVATAPISHGDYSYPASSNPMGIVCERFNSVSNAQETTVEDVLEYIEDEYAPALQPEETVYGGASVFKHQAACPFRAFALMRLGAASIPMPAFSMTPQERGVCLHTVLEQVWRVLGDHTTLCQYDQDALENLLNPIVSEVLNATAQKRVFTLKARFIALEQQRLTQQLMSWLTLEKQRPSFRVIGLESEHTLQFAGLSLKLRVDREDELEDGSRMLIDYKTGACSPADWFGERPDDPQLPLYSVTCEHPITGLAFAQISADNLQLTGISEKDFDLFNVVPIGQQKLNTVLYTWDAFTTATKISLTHLAEEFQAGYAKVDPKKLEKTCERCDLQPLCRINEHAPNHPPHQQSAEPLLPLWEKVPEGRMRGNESG